MAKKKKLFWWSTAAPLYSEADQAGDPFKQPVLIGSPISKNYFIKLMRKFIGVLLGPTQLLHNNPSAILIEPSGQKIT
jgi:hypothetical protein